MASFEIDETQRTGRPASTLADLPGLDLVVVAGPESGARVHVVGSVTRIGSAEANQLRLIDPGISRLHCELHVTRDCIVLQDSGSTNGTYVGPIRVERAEIPLGAVVHLGHSAFRVEASGQSASVPVSPHDRFGELLGASFEMRVTYARLERLAQNDATALILGETGTGKDVAARSLHHASSRRAGPFVAVDCGAIPEHLCESELFGHVRGAFTGATHHRKGVFEEAHGGTLFLDEVGELPLAMQAKLLRALETRSVRRVGANTTTPVDVRVIAATNVMLSDGVNRGTFREDLYYRLAVVEVHMPALRERRADIPSLARHFHQRLAPHGEPLPEAFLARLMQRSWPGNVRELRNYVERSVVLQTVSTTTNSTVSTTTTTSESEEIDVEVPFKIAKGKITSAFERRYLTALMTWAEGNVSAAARKAKMDRMNLYRLIQRYDIKASFRD